MLYDDGAFLQPQHHAIARRISKCRPCCRPRAAHQCSRVICTSTSVARGAVPGYAEAVVPNPASTSSGSCSEPGLAKVIHRYPPAIQGAWCTGFSHNSQRESTNQNEVKSRHKCKFASARSLMTAISRVFPRCRASTTICV